ncbi:hypothetical protein B5E41_26645 [Rhizobium esperanzae]|uniref:Uncharacterized protein n=1 Tax=Rhizobium esperanzae TaxID=1967781 RepID=A0A2D0AAF1_9HYPH|nr:hypothetical protein [Rhizobium esperanzae]OWO91573.1 hypothetical protein B5E41_26645 [Rhizobium esperanzae]
MKALKSLRQLLEIRSLRADNLSRSLSEARADAENAREREAKASEALDIAASRAAGNPIVDELRKSGVISAAKLQDALMRQSVLRSHEADAGRSLAQRKDARCAAQERAEQAAADFSRALKAVLRAEFSLEAAEKVDR